MNVTHEISIQTVSDFVAKLLHTKIESGFVVTNKFGNVVCSHPVLQELKHIVEQSPSFKNHEGIFLKVDKPSNYVFFVFVHKTVRGNAQGGTRMLSYDTVSDLVEDGLRLSKAMTDKNAIAGLWWGGGKSVVCPLNKDEVLTLEKRNMIFQQFGKFVAKLKGVYVAAEDMNTTPMDMKTILSVNRFVTCLPEVVGGSANPSPWTARGVFNAISAVVKFYEDKDSLKEKVVLVQGVGNVGSCIVKLLVDSGALVKVSDPNRLACQKVATLSNVVVLSDDVDVYSEPCDIFVPCAMGGGLNSKTIPLLKARYLVGAANNQLLDPEIDSCLIEDHNMVYLPDFFVNRMGIVNCANEQYGRLESDLLKATRKVYTDTVSLLLRAKNEECTPYRVAVKLANELSYVPHPVWGHRGKVLIEDIISKW